MRAVSQLKKMCWQVDDPEIRLSYRTTAHNRTTCRIEFKVALILYTARNTFVKGTYVLFYLL